MAGQDKESTDRVKQTAERIWRAGLGALASAERHGNELFDRLSDAGERFEKEHLRPAGEVAERELRAAGHQAERFVEREWSRFVSAIGASRDEEVDSLRREVARLKKDLKAAEGRGAAPARKKTSRKKTSVNATGASRKK